ncbi:hypothetical protein LCGC14_2861940 [marine sediment metagenome]|uniref:Signal transduction histidine kinase dimerisation/phosphoacceptor domain-containing protein n=1 Tax=marine sediment metagenome TaxID=412755 RepID=A0A0F8Y597_9ZZZZ
MALEQAKVERLANEARNIATLAALICNPVVLERDARALDLLRALDAALEQTKELTQAMIDAA